MSTETIPQTDWDTVHRWEWFRRPQWEADFRAHLLGTGGGLPRAFADLCREAGAEVALDAGCGLGRRTIALAERGVNVLGSDTSRLAIERARDLARTEDARVTFLQSSHAALPETAPHRFDAILCAGLPRIPSWEALRGALSGLYGALRPGGFLLFPGAEGEEAGADGARKRLEAEWRRFPAERAAWFHREGALSCSLVVRRTKGEDYIDEHRLYVIAEAGAPRLETVDRRIPGYWTQAHWDELVRGAGFRHLEIRLGEGYGPGGSRLAFHVGWKSGEETPAVDTAGRNTPYLD